MSPAKTHNCSEVCIVAENCKITWVNVFKNRLKKISGRQTLKNLK